MTLTYSVNEKLQRLPTSKVDKDRLSKLSNTGWQVTTSTWFELAERMSGGLAVAPVYENGYRSNETFSFVEFVTLDFDHGTPVLDIARHPLCKQFACIIGATASHKKEAPRSRLLFATETIMSTKEYDHLLSSLFAEFASLKPDKGASGASRFFFGLQRAPLLVFTNFNRRLTVTTLAPMPVEKPRPVYTPLPMVGNAHMLLLWAAREIEAQRDGTRNTTLYSWARSVGKRVKQGVLSESEAVNALLNAALKTGLGEREILRTIASAFRATGASS